MTVLTAAVVSDEQELIGGDVDLDELTLVKAAAGRKLDVRERIVGGSVARTIEGASTVTVQLEDPGDTLLNGFLANPGKVDVELDGLWFRLVSLRTTGQTLELQFEDRAVALLRTYPSKAKKKTWFKRVPARGPGGMSRIEFARMLVAEVKEIEIPFVTVIDADKLAANDDLRRTARAPGFGPGVNVTVKGRRATKTQLENLDRVLAVGRSMLVRRKLLVCAVMTATQESSATNLLPGTALDGSDSRGVFQQRPSGGRPDGKGNWPASGNVATDARAFFEVAQWVDARKPSLTYEQLCSEVQRDYTFGTRQEGRDYKRWRTEAEHTVTVWGIGGTDTQSDTVDQSDFQTGIDTAGYFYRGDVVNVAGGKSRVKREDNWDCLQRLASEVNWRCFCASGAIHFTNDIVLFRSQPRMTVSRQDDAVDWIEIDDYDVSLPKSSLTVTARTRRWQAPPGTLTAVEKLGPASGRWLVATIERDLIGSNAEISLIKPQPVFPEDESPELAGTSTGGGSFEAVPGGADTDSAVRSRMMQLAQRAFDRRVDYVYDQIRPMPAGLFLKNPLPERIDCSAFATLLYKAAGAPDPNGFGYNGAGNTGTLIRQGRQVTVPKEGDLVFYGTAAQKGYPPHVNVYAGDGLVWNMGPAGLTHIRVTDVPLPLLGYWRFELAAKNAAQERHRHGDDR